jgi:hypothetical protein
MRREEWHVSQKTGPQSMEGEAEALGMGLAKGAIYTGDLPRRWQCRKMNTRIIV